MGKYSGGTNGGGDTTGRGEGFRQDKRVKLQIRVSTVEAQMGEGTRQGGGRGSGRIKELNYKYW